MSPRRIRKFPVLVLVLTVMAIATVHLLGARADASRQAQLRVSAMSLALTDLISAPFNADRTAGGSPSRARAEIRADEAVLARGLASTSTLEAPPAALTHAVGQMAMVKSTVDQIYGLAARPQGLNRDRRVPGLQRDLADETGGLLAVLKRINRTDAGRAQLTKAEVGAGTAVTMLALLGVFLMFYFRSVRIEREKQQLLDASRIEAMTDALTGLLNRRALTDDLDAEILSADGETGLLLAMFDLNGFKPYNDTFGHGAGDALLARFGARLGASTVGFGRAYRIGGDEFCLLARATPESAEALLRAAATALADRGDGWDVDCSRGAVWIPTEADTATEALKLADQRMYADKAARSSVGRHTAGVILPAGRP